MLQKQALRKSDTYKSQILKEFRDFLPLINSKSQHHSETGYHRSNIHYMELVDEHPDSDETMMHIAEQLLEELKYHEYVILVGDGKTYEHLMNIKRLYGSELEKLLIFPGDWHTLKNFQPVLMKAYYSAGLKELARACGFRGETLTKLESCSNFKRTHRFLQQAWEAIYHQMLCSFIKAQSSCDDMYQKICAIIGECIAAHNSPSVTLSKTQTLLTKMNFEQNFHDFVQKRAEDDDTWRFWKQFAFEDCFAYMSLYLAIRTSNWHLRQSSLKLMAPLFAAFDRTTYQKLIPHHLSDIITCYPDNIKKCLESGAFTVSITGRQWHSVALDECHEMCINKDMKSAVVRPTEAYLKKTSLFFGYRIAHIKPTHSAVSS